MKPAPEDDIEYKVYNKLTRSGNEKTKGVIIYKFFNQ